MEQKRERLDELARKCPWRMFNGEEIALLCNVSVTMVSLVKKEADSPFCTNKCRPEWFTEWMRTHHSFVLNRGPQENLSKKIDPSLSKPIRARRSSSKNMKGRSGA